MSVADLAVREVKLIIFKLGEEEYGIDILRVQEIKRMTNITRVPSTSPYIQGVINLRGRVLPVIDLKIRLGLPQTELTEDFRIVVVLADEGLVGFVVDEVMEVSAIYPQDIEPVQSLSSGLSAEFFDGIAKADQRLYILLNPDAIINFKDV